MRELDMALRVQFGKQGLHDLRVGAAHHRRLVGLDCQRPAELAEQDVEGFEMHRVGIGHGAVEVAPHARVLDHRLVQRRPCAHQ